MGVLTLVATVLICTICTICCIGLLLRGKKIQAVAALLIPSAIAGLSYFSTTKERPVSATIQSFEMDEVLDDHRHPTGYYLLIEGSLNDYEYEAVSGGDYYRHVSKDKKTVINYIEQRHECTVVREDVLKVFRLFWFIPIHKSKTEVSITYFVPYGSVRFLSE